MTVHSLQDFDTCNVGVPLNYIPETANSKAILIPRTVMPIENSQKTIIGSGTALYDIGEDWLAFHVNESIKAPNQGYGWTVEDAGVNKIILKMNHQQFSTKADTCTQVIGHGDSSTVWEDSEQKTVIVKELVQKGLIQQAREYLEDEVNCASFELDKWRKLLAPAKIKKEDKSTGKSTDKNKNWIIENSRYYRGNWVALKEGKLVGHNESRKSLVQSLRGSGTLKGAFLFNVGG